MPPRAHPRGFAIFFFFLGGLFPTPGHAETDNSLSRAPDRPHLRFLVQFLIGAKAKRDVFTTFINVFLNLLRER